MESQPQNPEFRNNPENSQPCGFVAFKLNKHVQKYYLLICLFPYKHTFKMENVSLYEDLWQLALKRAKPCEL